MDGWQDEQIQYLLNAETDVALFAELCRTGRELGFDYCAYGMRMPLPVSRPKFILLNNYSPSWQQRYADNHYIGIDPTVAHGMRSVMPLVWSNNVFANCQPFWEDARGHGLNIGWSQSCYNARGVGGLLTLARSHDNLSLRELRDTAAKMSWMAHVAHEGLSNLLIAKLMPEATAKLTIREIEVLKWTADGKTSGEVSEIMHISERTVNFHVNNALVKLDATNKTAAAVKAAILGLL